MNQIYKKNSLERTSEKMDRTEGRSGFMKVTSSHLQQRNSENCCLPMCELLVCNYLVVGEDFLQSLMAYLGLNRLVWQPKSFDTLILLASRNSKPLMVKQLV